MEQEAPNEFVSAQWAFLELAAILAIPVLECDKAILHVDDAVIGDRNPMSVTPEVIEYLLWTSKGYLGVDDPVLVLELLDEAGEVLGNSQGGHPAREHEFSFGEEFPEAIEELAAEDPGDCFDWEEVVVPRRDPTLPVGRQNSPGDYAVQVDVASKHLVPSMEHRREAEFSTKPMPGVASELLEAIGDGMEKKIEDDLLVCQGDRIDLVRQSKDIMEVTHWQEFCFASFEPLCFRQRLTFRAMPVSAGVVRDPLKTAGVAAFDVPTERGAAADFDCAHNLKLRGCQRMGTPVRFAVETKDVGNFPRGPFSALRSLHSSLECTRMHGGSLLRRSDFRDLKQVQRTLSSIDFLARQLKIFCCGSNRAMSHEQLNGAQIHSCFEQMGGEAVSQAMDTTFLLDAGLLFGLSVNEFSCAAG